MPLGRCENHKGYVSLPFVCAHVSEHQTADTACRVHVIIDEHSFVRLTCSSCFEQERVNFDTVGIAPCIDDHMKCSQCLNEWLIRHGQMPYLEAVWKRRLEIDAARIAHWRFEPGEVLDILRLASGPDRPIQLRVTSQRATIQYEGVTESLEVPADFGARLRAFTNQLPVPTTSQEPKPGPNTRVLEYGAASTRSHWFVIVEPREEAGALLLEVRHPPS